MIKKTHCDDNETILIKSDMLDIDPLELKALKTSEPLC